MQDISEKIMARHGLTPIGFLTWQARFDKDVMAYLVESFLELADSREVTDLLTELYLELGEGLD
jgi:hypothetical protein